MIKKILKILVIIIVTCLLAIAIMYVYVSSKHSRVREEMLNPENFDNSKVGIDTLELSSKERRFADSLRNIGFEDFNLYPIHQYIKKEPTDSRFYRNSYKISYKRRRPFKPFFPDSSERYKFEVTLKLFCNYLSEDRQLDFNKFTIKDLDFSMPESEIEQEELQQYCE